LKYSELPVEQPSVANIYMQDSILKSLHFWIDFSGLQAVLSVTESDAAFSACVYQQ